MTAPAVAWRSGPDQISHGYTPTRGRGPSRAFCGVALVAERLAWPPVVRCPDCLMVLGRVGMSA